MQIPPDTSNAYMLLGYAVVVLILFGIVAFLVSRTNRLRAELGMLHDLEQDTKPPAKRAP